MTQKNKVYTIIHISSWIIAVAAILYIGIILYGGRTALAEETNTLVCVPASQNTSYTLPPSTQWRITDTSNIGDTSWSGHYVGQSIITDGDDEYIGYYNADRRMTIGHRTHGESAWQLYNLPDAQAVVGWDSHNYIALAVDKTGNLHVAGNMHTSGLTYWRTTTPRQLTSLQRVPTMVSQNIELSMTYPQFLKDKQGELIYSYRDGQSGSGQTYFNKYNTQTKTWSALLSTDLFDGAAQSPDRSSYFNLSPAPNADGYYEMTWMWRDTGDVATNSRLSYARSSDLQHWETINGSPITLPITYDTPGVVFDDVPENGGLFNNQERLGVDANGKTTITYSKYDENGSNQIYIARPDTNLVWQTTKITQWTGKWRFWGNGTLAARIGVGSTAVLPDGKLRLNFSCGGATAGSGTIIVNNDTLSPFAQTGTYNPDTFPNEIYQTTATTPPSPSRRVTAVSTDGLQRYIMRWQSQGTNQDAAFPSWPAAQPVTVFSLVKYAAAQAPTNLSVTYSEGNTAATLTWTAPTENGGYPVTDYLVEYSADQGTSWTTFTHSPSTTPTATIPGLDAEALYAFRVSAVTAFGVGNSAITFIPDTNPVLPGPTNGGSIEPPLPAGGVLPLPPNTGGFQLPTTVHPLVIIALGCSSAVLIFIAARRRYETQ